METKYINSNKEEINSKVSNIYIYYT